MDLCSDKWLSPSKSTASPKHLSNRENNENDPSQQDNVIPKFQDQNKPFAKHFMAPTISAASKATPPRNKILSERNENSFISDFQIPKPQKKKYDPLTNYLSPRPKYLRFNPNRRREIFTRLEKEELDDNSSSDSHSEEVNDEESVVNPENEENNNLEGDENNICNDYEDVEEDDDEEEEDSGWRFKAVLKFVLTLIIFVLSTSYICTMNSTQQQDVWPKVKDGFFMVKRQTLEVVSLTIWKNEFLKMKIGEDYNEFEESEFEESAFKANDNVGIVEDDDVENLEVVEINGVENQEIEETIKLGAAEDDDGNSEVVEIFGDKNREIEEHVEKIENDLVENEMEDCSDQSVIKAESFDRMVGVKSDKSVNAESFAYPALNEDNAEKIEAAKREIVSETESYEQTTAEKPDESVNADEFGPEMEIKGSDQPPVLTDDTVEKNDLVENEIGDNSDQSEVKAESFDRSVDVKTNECVNAELFASPSLNEGNAEKIEAVETEIGSETERYEQLTAAKSDKSENADEYGPEMETKGSDQSQELKVEQKDEAVIFGVAMILTSLGIVVYRFKKSRITFAEKSVSVVIKPHKLATAVEEKKKIEFIARPSMLDSTEEAPKKLDRFVYAPSVELIGEIVVGRASNANNNKIDQPVLAQTQMPAHGYSNITSSSFGSFTTETKISKKEQGDQSRERAVESTPVRRSSRLRSRSAAMSP